MALEIAGIWDWIHGETASLSSEDGRPGIETRFMMLFKRFGDKLEPLLAESLPVAQEARALRSSDLKRVTATVQPKAISFPTDAKLLHAAIRT